MYCTTCGAYLKITTSRVCPKCGSSLRTLDLTPPSAPPPAEPKRVSVLALIQQLLWPAVLLTILVAIMGTAWWGSSKEAMQTSVSKPPSPLPDFFVPLDDDPPSAFEASSFYPAETPESPPAPPLPVTAALPETPAPPAPAPEPSVPATPVQTSVIPPQPDPISISLSTGLARVVHLGKIGGRRNLRVEFLAKNGIVLDAYSEEALLNEGWEIYIGSDGQTALLRNRAQGAYSIPVIDSTLPRTPPQDISSTQNIPSEQESNSPPNVDASDEIAQENLTLIDVYRKWRSKAEALPSDPLPSPFPH